MYVGRVEPTFGGVSGPMTTVGRKFSADQYYRTVADHHRLRVRYPMLTPSTFEAPLLVPLQPGRLGPAGHLDTGLEGTRALTVLIVTADQGRASVEHGSYDHLRGLDEEPL